ncbi:MAG: hypothetical protein GY725_02100 [bacterium]|nr:hypothetical protein [bacterium]
MADENQNGSRAAVNGSCKGCGCRLGYTASQREQEWYCCGACAGSDRCSCGCKPELERDEPTDVFVPTRRMFASRHPDGLKTTADRVDKMRAFPFSDRDRGR